MHKTILSTILLLLVAVGVCLADDPLYQWTTNQGTTEVSGDVLHWSYNLLTTDANYMTRAADAEWQAMNGISFYCMSDVLGSLFLRFDQSDGNVFLYAFQADTVWGRFMISLDEFEPAAGSTGRLNPSLITNIYFVDNNGRDGTLAGSRNVYFKNFKFTFKNIKLIGFDADGYVRTIDDYEDLGLSAERWCFLADENGTSIQFGLADSTAEVDGANVTAPNIMFDDNVTGVELNVLYWPVGDDYKIWLKTDYKGQGLETYPDDNLNLNFELAYTRQQEIYSYGDIEGDINATQTALDFKNQLDALTGTEKQIAADADAILKDELDYSKVQLNKGATERIEAKLEPSVNATASDLFGSVADGTEVKIHLKEPAFRIGFGQSFGFESLKYDPEIVKYLYNILKSYGFNHADMALFWDQVVDKYGDWTTWEDMFCFDYLRDNGFTLLPHGIIQTGQPDNVKKLTGQDWVDAAKDHLAKMIDHIEPDYGSAIDYWEIANEPSMNEWGDLSVDERITMLGELHNIFLGELPDKLSLINDYDWQRGWSAYPQTADKILNLVPFYKRFIDSGNGTEVLGLEWYPGARVKQPEFGLDMAEPCKDMLDTYFFWHEVLDIGRPVFIVEAGVPGAMSSNDKNGYAWGKWSEQTQAEAGRDLLRLAMSIDDMMGFVWWGITDKEPWNYYGGLFGQYYRPRDIMRYIRSFYFSLQATHTTTVSNGNVEMPTLDGRYCTKVDGQWYIVTVDDGNYTSIPLD